MQFFFKLVQKLHGHQNLLNYARVQYFSLVVRIVSFKRFFFFTSILCPQEKQRISCLKKDIFHKYVRRVVHKNPGFILGFLTWVYLKLRFLSRMIYWEPKMKTASYTLLEASTFYMGTEWKKIGLFKKTSPKKMRKSWKRKRNEQYEFLRVSHSVRL